VGDNKVDIPITGLRFLRDSNRIKVYSIKGTRIFLFEFKCPNASHAQAVLDSLHFGELTKNG